MTQQDDEPSKDQNEESRAQEEQQTIPAWIKTGRHFVDAFGPLIVMSVVVVFLIFVVGLIFWPRDGTSIVFRSQGGPAAFDATSALSYADRVSRIAEITVGGVLTLALGLVGFSWLGTNARIERDRQELNEHKDNLEKKLDHKLTDEAARLGNQIASLSSHMERTQSDIESLRGVTDQLLQDQRQTWITSSLQASGLWSGSVDKRRSKLALLVRLVNSGDFDVAFGTLDEILSETIPSLENPLDYSVEPTSFPNFSDMVMLSNVLQSMQVEAQLVSSATFSKHCSGLLASLNWFARQSTRTSIESPMSRLKMTIAEQAEDLTRVIRKRQSAEGKNPNE